MPKAKKVPENQKFSYANRTLEPAAKSIMTDNRSKFTSDDDDGPRNGGNGFKKGYKSQRQSDYELEEPRQGFMKKRQFARERERGGEKLLFSTTMMAGANAYAVSTFFQPVDVADNVITWGKDLPQELKKQVSNCYLHPGFVVKQHSGMVTTNRRLVVTLQKNKQVEEINVHGFIQVLGDALWRMTNNASLYPLAIMDNDAFTMFHDVGVKIDEQKVPGYSLAKSFYALQYPFSAETEPIPKQLVSTTPQGVRPQVEVAEVESSVIKYGTVKAMPVVSPMPIPGKLTTPLVANRDFLTPSVAQLSCGVVIVDDVVNGQCAYVESAAGATYILSVNHVANVKAKSVVFHFPCDDVTVKQSTFTYDEAADVYLQREKLAIPALKVAKPADNVVSRFL